MDTLHKNSHLVYIRRLPQFATAARKELEEFFAEGQRGYGSYFAKGSVRTATGLTPSEEDLLMPYILNIPKEDREFRGKVTAWFESIGVKVPAKNGVELEIGLEEGNDKSLSETNRPLNVEQYVKYRHALGHPWVAPSEEEGRGDQLKQYYIFDPAKVSKTNININEKRDEAMTHYLSIKDNKRTVSMYLTLLGVRTDLLRAGEEVMKLRELVDKTPEKFLAVYADRDKETKYVIEDMINNHILERVDSNILIKGDGTLIGRDMKSAILFITDAKNTKIFNVLKSRLQEAWKKNSTSVETDEDLEIPTPIASTPVAEVQEEELVPAAEIIPAAPEPTIEPDADGADSIDE